VEPIRDLGKIEAMKKILRGQNVRDWLLFILGINSALRVSDLLRLRQSDVCDERGRVLAKRNCSCLTRAPGGHWKNICGLLTIILISTFSGQGKAATNRSARCGLGSC
jgi:hypothetical protein